MKKAIVVSGMILATVVATQSVFAVAGNKEDRAAARDAKKAEVTEKRTERICNRIATRVESMRDKTAKREQLGLDKVTERLAKVKEKRTVRHEELAQRRTQRDAQRQAFYANLMAQAQTDAQKAAVTQFEATVEQAVKERRAAIDAATLAMQNDVDALVVKKQDEIERLFEDYKKAEEAAFAKAENACGDTSTETDLKSIAQTLNADLKVARNDFSAGIRDTRTMGTEIQQLAETKRKAVQSAVEVFKKTVQQARVQLQAAFGGEIMVDDDTEINDTQTSDADQNEVVTNE